MNATTEHAPVGAWGPDFLGPGFEARTLELLPDDEDDGAVATLVRHLPALDPGALPGTPTSPSFIYLYLHGWNDYFFQTHLAREISRLGGAFYALDLRRYGRSWREGQMLGWCTSLADYDEDLGWPCPPSAPTRAGRPRSSCRATPPVGSSPPCGPTATRGPCAPWS